LLSIIVAIANNNVIGKDNKIIWNLPEDMKHFKNITFGHTIIMGKETFKSIGRVLPNRKHIVFSKNKKLITNNKDVKIVSNISEIEDLIESNEEVFVIGGATIYNLLMPYVKKMYITRIYQEFEGDTYFPLINENEWKIIQKEKGTRNEKNNLDYEFIYIERKNI